MGKDRSEWRAEWIMHLYSCINSLNYTCVSVCACIVREGGCENECGAVRPIQHSPVRRRSSHSPTCVWVSARGFSIIQPWELAWGGETRVGNGILRAVVSIRKTSDWLSNVWFSREGWRFKISPETVVKVGIWVFYTCRLGSDEEMCLSLRHLEHLIGEV